MIEQTINTLGWNVSGLNDQDRKDTVHKTIAASSCHIVCLQETNLESVSTFNACYIGGNRLKSFAERPAIGTRGGMLLLWDDSLLQMSNIITSEFCLSADVHILNNSNEGDFKITTVYGPTASNRKDDFFAELIAHKPPFGVRWLVLGDFNQIRRARDKNKANVNRSRINRFRDALQACELHEVHLQNCRFTWSNERENPTLCKLDAFYCNNEWDVCYDTHVLTALSSSLSDHCPLFLADDRGPRRPRSFKFENFWIKVPGFMEVINQAWNAPSIHVDPCHILFHKLKSTAKALSSWSRKLFSNTKVMMHATLLIILHLDLAQESRTLNAQERDLRAKLKRKVIALAVVERARRKQSACIANIREGDANTKFFHLRVNARRSKNHIHRIKHNNGWVTDHGAKEQIIQNNFSSVMGRANTCTIDFNWESIHFDEPNLLSLGAPFTEEEVLRAITRMPSDKAPGPDGFTGAFFKKCWGTIKNDIMRSLTVSGTFMCMASIGSSPQILPFCLKKKARKRSWTLGPLALFMLSLKSLPRCLPPAFLLT
jgi:exonuclease III